MLCCRVTTCICSISLNGLVSLFREKFYFHQIIFYFSIVFNSNMLKNLLPVSRFLLSFHASNPENV